MKFFLGILAVSSIGAAAQECSSVWIYHPWASCRAESNPADLTADLSSVPVESAPQEFQYGFDYGGAGHGEALCNSLAPVAKFNESRGPSLGLLATSSQFSRTVPDGNRLRAGYNYFCNLTVKKYPRVEAQNSRCGDDKTQWSYKKSPLKDGILSNDAVCLSCDPQINAGSPRDAVACLRQNLNEVINKLPIQGLEIRDDDFDKIASNVSAVIDYEKTGPGTMSIRDAELFKIFLTAHPAKSTSTGQ